jgi:MYXO-CTERM domain-containing protein
MRSILRFGAAAAVLTWVAFGAGTAMAVGIQPNMTSTTLEAGRASLLLTGLVVGPTGTGGQNSLGEITLPVTGGDIDFTFLTGTIEHAGSGIAVSSATSVVQLDNLVFDLTNFQVLADLTITPTGGQAQTTLSYHLFDLEICQFAAGVDPCITAANTTRLDGWGLRLTYDASTDTGSAKDLAVALGLPGAAAALAADHLAIARLNVVPVPEPGSALLALVGLAGLAARRARTLRT